MKNITRALLVLGTASAVALPTLPAFSASAKAGAKCRKVGEVVGDLTCVAKGKSRVYAKIAAPVTTKAPAASSGGAATPAPAGLATVPGFDGKTITIGYIGNVVFSPQFPSSALFADGGKALTAGFNAYISRVNDAGGVAGKYPINTLYKETYYDVGEADRKSVV